MQRHGTAFARTASTPWSHAPWLELLHAPPVGDYRHPFAELADPPRVGADGCFAVPGASGPGVRIDPAAVA